MDFKSLLFIYYFIIIEYKSLLFLSVYYYSEKKNYDESNFTDKKHIARGAYGDIYSAFSKLDNEYLCLKEINVPQKEDECKKYVDNEIRLLELFSKYPNSVKYYGNYDYNDKEKGEKKVIVLEKCDGNLKEYMKDRPSLDISKIREILFGLNKVFKAMYNEKVIHRDLKLQNLLIKYENNNKEKFIVKLGDYGLGKFLYESDSFSGIKGTAETVAPEIILEKIKKYEINSTVDVFSLGVILYQLSHKGKHPFEEPFFINYHIYYDKDNFDIHFDSSIKNKDFKDLLRKMLKINPKNRITWEQYFNHPFFK